MRAFIEECEKRVSRRSHQQARVTSGRIVKQNGLPDPHVTHLTNLPGFELFFSEKTLHTNPDLPTQERETGQDLDALRV